MRDLLRFTKRDAKHVAVYFVLFFAVGQFGGLKMQAAAFAGLMAANLTSALWPK